MPHEEENKRDATRRGKQTTTLHEPTRAYSNGRTNTNTNAITITITNTNAITRFIGSF
jgi:hypothetical protein